MQTYLAFALGLVATLVLAAYLTPRSWWRRPNVRALAVLAGGTWGMGSLLLWLTQTPAMAKPPPAPPLAAAPAALPAGTYHVFEDLNLRAASSTGAKRIAVVPVGSVVTATGLRNGDWWQLNATVNGKPVQGWASSLWLRRADEARR